MVLMVVKHVYVSGRQALRRTTYARPGLLFRLVDRVPARLPLERGQTTRRQGHRTGPNSGPRGAASIPQRREHSSPTRTTIAACTQEVVGLVGHPQSVRTIGANLVDRQSHPAAKTSAKAIAVNRRTSRLMPLLSPRRDSRASPAALYNATTVASSGH